MNRLPKAVYTSEFRAEAVALAMTGGVGLTEAARRLCMSNKTLEGWVYAERAGQLERIGQHQKPLSSVDAELNQL